MKSREELIRESLEIEAQLLERLGRVGEAKEVRARVPVVPQVSKGETVNAEGSLERTVIANRSARGAFAVTRRNGEVGAVPLTKTQQALLRWSGDGIIVFVDGDGNAHQIAVEEKNARRFWPRRRPKVTVAREGMSVGGLPERAVQEGEARTADEPGAPGVLPVQAEEEVQLPRRPQRISPEQRKLDNEQIEILDYLYRHGFRADEPPPRMDAQRTNDNSEGDDGANGV